MQDEKQKMKAYSNKMALSVKSLQSDVKSLKNNWKQNTKHLRNAAAAMHNEGINTMKQKLGKFNSKIAGFRNEIQDQVKENKECAAHICNNIKYFNSEINAKKKAFRSYARGPFNDYIKAFWGTSE